jgi:hypothetical protein
VVEYLNEGLDCGWKKVIEEKNFTSYKKMVPNQVTVMIKAFGLIHNFTKEQIIDSISDFNIRKEWDKIFCNYRFITHNDEDNSDIFYLLLKPPSFLIKERDFVWKKKVFRNFPDESSSIIHIKSVQHKDCPETKERIRAETIIQSYYVKTVSSDPLITSITCLGQTDPKGSVPLWIINKLSEKAPREWINNLLKGMEVAKNKKLI